MGVMPHLARVAHIISHRSHEARDRQAHTNWERVHPARLRSQSGDWRPVLGTRGSALADAANQEIGVPYWEREAPHSL